MPTYDYKCAQCGDVESVFQSISSYISQPRIPHCEMPTHGNLYMERMLSVNPAMSGLANALAGDRHYDGQRTADGVDISSRTKHKQYMKERGLTTADDYKETWTKQQNARELLRLGKQSDKDLRRTLEQVVPQHDK